MSHQRSAYRATTDDLTEPEPTPAAPVATAAGARTRLLVNVLTVSIVAIALIAGAAVRLDGMHRKHSVHHDEVISYLAAAGHERAFQRAVAGGLTGRWVPASQWQRLLKPDAFLPLTRISSDLGHTDSHPPLYFWLLHLWTVAFGFRLHDGIALNIILAAATTLALFGLARSALRSPVEAALVALVWAVSAGAVTVTLMVRHYELFALVTVLFVWATIAFTRPRLTLRWYHFVCYAAATAAGALTHYHFAIVLSGGALFAAARLGRRREWPRLGRLALSAVAGLVVFVAAEPWFLTSTARQHSEQAGGLSWAGFVHRQWVARESLSHFFAFSTSWGQTFKGDVYRLADQVNRGHLGPRPTLVLVAVAAVFVAVAIPGSRTALARYARTIDTHGLPVLWFLVWIGGGTVALYLAFQSPPYAMMDRYLAAVWPFLAFVPVFLGRLLKRPGMLVVALYALLILLPASHDVALGYHVGRVGPTAALAAANRVVIDTTDRGDLPRAFVDLPADARVFVEPVQSLTAGSPRWITPLRPGDLIISRGETSASARTARQQVLALLATRFTLERAPSLWGFGHLYRVASARTY